MAASNDNDDFMYRYFQGLLISLSYVYLNLDYKETLLMVINTVNLYYHNGRKGNTR